MKLKLHWKLTLIFCSALTFCLLLGYFYIAGHLKNYFENNLTNNLRRQLMLSRDFIAGQGLADADALADKIASDLGVRVTIIGADGAVAGDSDLSAQGLAAAENHLTRPEVQDALSKGLGISNRYSYTTKKYMLYMAAPLGPEKDPGFLRLAVPLADIERLDKKIQSIIIIALFLILLLGLGLTFLASIAVSRPLVQMSAAAKAMAGGDFSKKPPVYSQDEIGELAAALRNMAEQINGKIEKLNQERAKLDAVFLSMFEGIMVTDEKSRILLINPSLAKIFLINSPAEGKRPLEIIRNTAVQDVVDSVINDRRRILGEEVTINQPEEKTLKVNAAPIIRQDKLEGAILVFHDISELRKLEKVRQDFVANVSHELRTPVSSIKGYAETLLDWAIDDKKNVREYVDIIHQNSDRLIRLIDDLLNLSKIESGKMPMVLLPVDMAVVLARSVTVLEKLRLEKAISLRVDAAQDLPKALADEQRLSQVLVNLLDNAIKYTPHGGAITVSISLEDKFIQVSISDTGIGIPAQDLPRIFERFYRVDKARSRELGGTGLGLSIVRHIIQAHSGQVWVQSELGRGSTFSFTVPAAL